MTEGQEESLFIDRVNTLHRHFDGVSTRLDEVQRTQERLEANDVALVQRVGKIEVDMMREQGLLATHIATTALHLKSMSENTAGVRTDLVGHMAREDKDRRWLLVFVFTTMSASLGGLLKMTVFAGG